MDAKVRDLIDSAAHLAWATGVEIQGGKRSRSFINQHRAKCRYWIEQVKKATDALNETENSEHLGAK